MTNDEYQRICDRLARKAIRFATKMVDDEELTRIRQRRLATEQSIAAQREHWINMFMDEHLPDIDPDVLLEVTRHADAWGKSGGLHYAGKEVRAIAAFQADVWDAIRTEIASSFAEHS